MTGKRSIRKFFKIILVAVGVLLLVGIAANSILKNIIEKQLRISLRQFQPYVEAGFSNAHINLFAATVKLDSLFIIYDPELKQEHEHVIHFSSAKISGIQFFKLFTAKDFHAASFKLNSADIKLDRYLVNKNDTLPAALFKSIKMPFKKIFFDAVEINNAKIFQYNDKRTTTICDGNISFNNLSIPRIDTLFSKDSIRFTGFVCDLYDINYHLNSYYTVHVKNLYANSRDSLIKLDLLKFVPQVGKFQLGEKLGRQADYIVASVKAVKISGVNLFSLRQKKLIAHDISVQKCNVYVFRDRRLPRGKEKQPMPMDYLKQIPFEMDVQQFNLSETNITSEEFPKEGDHTGYIKLENLSVSMRPFINHSTKENSSVNSYIKASIMGAGNIRATINLSLINGNSQIKGAISDLHLTAMNPSAENLGKFHIQSGILNHLDFQFVATEAKASGQIVGEYHDLVIDRLKPTKHGLKKAKLPSFFLHSIIIPKDKDASLDVKKRTGKIDYDRDPTRLVTLYYLKALLDGIRDSFALGFVLPD